jgi:N-succinyldiaminopimelate aminotransferase
VQSVNDRLDLLGDYPFRRMAALLAQATPPPGMAPLSMAAGDPTRSPPAFAADIIAANSGMWGSYPPTTGLPEWRQAAIGWLNRRFGLPAGMLDEAVNVAPAPGTREALFLTGLAVVPTHRGGGRPLVAMPNPFYQVYAGAAGLSGAETLFLPAVREQDFLPDLDAFEALGPETLNRMALFYLCSPANPQGTVASIAYLKRLITLGRTHGFVVAVDECYTDVYFDLPPPGALEAAAALDGTADGVVTFHSLSKRSSAAGMRSGFVAGDAKVIRALTRVMEYGGAGMPVPIQRAAAALWNDDAHTVETRAFYRGNFDIAARRLGNRFGFFRPPAGFFLWLEVGDGEAAALKLWREAGVRVLPGGYLGRPDAEGRNPGAAFLRIALVHDAATTDAALDRVGALL